MQLKLSIAAMSLLASISAQAQDYVTFQYLQYNENDNRTAISAPSIMINKNFGVDYTLNVSFVGDAVSGASPTYYDASSGASAFSRNTGINVGDLGYGNIEYEETRLAGAIALTSRFANRDELTVGFNHSSENDFYSSEASAEYMHWLDDSKNQSLTFGMSYQINEILVNCVENLACNTSADTSSGVSTVITADTNSGASKAMDATLINAQLSFSQNIDSQSYAKVSLFAIVEDGYLSNPYMNVVRYYKVIKADVVAENKPDTRMAYGASIKYANALTDTISTQLAYRYYTDDWGINSHTLDSDIYYEYNSDWILKLGLRGYIQSKADFYSADRDYFTNEIYASHDQRMSSFSSITYKTDVDYKISDELSVNVSGNFYYQTNGNNAIYFMSGFKYNF